MSLKIIIRGNIFQLIDVLVLKQALSYLNWSVIFNYLY